MQRLLEEGHDDPHRLRQLAALRYYLRHLLLAHADAWRAANAGATNHVALVDIVRHHFRAAQEPVWFVTFNYDRLIEEALEPFGVGTPVRGPVTQEDLSGYVSHPFMRLAKLHGSVDWGHVTTLPEQPDDAHAMAQVIENAATAPVADRIVQVARQAPPATQAMRLDEGRKPLLPAIAIPVQRKDAFECPQEHLAALRHDLPRITKIMVIGWRATEQHFLGMLKGPVSGEVRLLVANGTVAEGKLARDRLAGSLKIASRGGDDGIVAGGFTDLIRSRLVEEFLAL